jgi:hypothetical protein
MRRRIQGGWFLFLIYEVSKKDENQNMHLRPSYSEKDLILDMVNYFTA